MEILIEILGHFNIVIIIIGGLLIVNTNKKIKLIGLGFYYFCNIVSLILYFLSGLYFFLSSAIIFVIVNTINLFQILKQR